MTRTLWFVVPVAGRESLTSVCLRQLRRTCNALTDFDIDATAVVIGNDQNLQTARELGFGTVERSNYFLAMKFNDGIQLACDPSVNPRPADYVVPCGSDDWVDHRLFQELPGDNNVLCFRWAAFVNEDATRISSRRLDYPGGVGIRVYPRAMVERLNYRPADEDRKRGCDTSMLINLQRSYKGVGLNVDYGDQHEHQIVDWKTSGTQLNTFRDIMTRHRKGRNQPDPFEVLSGTFPTPALEEMREHYQRVPVAA